MNCANHPDRERISFCQNCGKPLCPECSRTVGSGVFCEPCLAARLAAANTPFPNQPVAGISVPVADGGPNPVLAAVLGFIPGVGAMYNGQYAKGAVHLIVFAVLVSIAADANGILETFAGLFIPGWEFYMAFEAYHTARARRDGTPLPNPFGLNDIGERLGFTKSWMPPVGSPSPTGVFTGVPPQPISTHIAQEASGNFIYSASDGTAFTQSASGAQTYTGPAAPPAAAWSSNTAYTSSYAPPSAQPFTPIPPDPAFVASQQNRFPTGAIWLIGLGLFFFFGSTGILHGFPIHRLFPFLLIGFGVWLFIRKMTGFGHSLDDDGSPEYRQRVVMALRGSIWIVLVGVLFLLDSFNVLSWGRSWPLFIIVAGLMTLLQRYAYTAPPAAAFPYAANPMPPTSAPVATETTPIQEER